jgi:hypothetical protein
MTSEAIAERDDKPAIGDRRLSNRASTMLLVNLEKRIINRGLKVFSKAR